MTETDEKFIRFE